MIIISERKKRNEIHYRETIKENDKTIAERDIYYHGTKVTKNNRIFYLLYDKDMNPVEEVFTYLNDFLSREADNTKEQRLHALKFLFSFQDIIGKRLEEFSPTDITSLIQFLRGQNREGDNVAFKRLTYRSAYTVNGYLSVYRSFLIFLGEENTYLSERVRKDTGLHRYHNMNYKKPRYLANESIHAENEVPMYISLEEYWKIIQLIRKEYTIREECIVRLMYEGGMRIGEVLGLTNEDITVEKIKDKYQAMVYIRNRLTDNPKWQHAKTCMKVNSKEDYTKPEYQEYMRAYQLVYISQDLYETIGDYVDTEHRKQRQKHKDNYFNHTITDSVEDEKKKNYYLFINGVGTPLSGKSWNKMLKEIYKRVGVPLDKDVRKHNLSHRFRHGFAMFQIQYLGINELQLSILMRHRSVQSVYKYFRPTISDQIKIKTTFADELYKMFPALQQYREED